MRNPFAITLPEIHCLLQSEWLSPHWAATVASSFVSTLAFSFLSPAWIFFRFLFSPVPSPVLLSLQLEQLLSVEFCSSLKASSLLPAFSCGSVELDAKIKTVQQPDFTVVWFVWSTVMCGIWVNKIPFLPTKSKKTTYKNYLEFLNIVYSIVFKYFIVLNFDKVVIRRQHERWAMGRSSLLGSEDEDVWNDWKLTMLVLMSTLSI